MDINWYPGHMTKSMRMIEENIKLIDAVIYVLDARAPYSCLNPNFKSVIGSLPILYVVNKADLGDSVEIDRWTNILSTLGSAVLKAVSTGKGSADSIVAAVKKVCGNKLEKYRLKGVKTTLKAMVLGVPNSGKSTLINSLCKSAKTVTGDKAGVTRGKQWVRVNDYFEVLDTPGTLYPKLTNQKVARHLAYIGSIKDEVVDTCELAGNLMEDLFELYPGALKERFGIIEKKPKEELLLDAAKKRGYILRGGQFDVERISTAVLDDFRKGRLGKITLDKVEDYDGGII